MDSKAMMEESSKVQQQYKDGLAYIKRMGFLDHWPLYERFKAGDQWPPVTKRTENLPRPVFNIIRYIENHKVSTVMNENVKMLFSPQELEEQDSAETPQNEQQESIYQDAADKFTRFSDTTWENIKQDELNEEALESGANLGTGIWHYYWDNHVKGGTSKPYIGEMCGEIIDPLNIFWGNPQQRRVQKQPFIIISFRDEVDNVKAEAKANGAAVELVDMITTDKDVHNEGYDRARVELTDEKKTTVLTKYWKESGMIFFEKVCGSVVVKPKTPTGMKLYPIAVMQWERRKKSIYGVGDTEGIIPNQKAVNFLMAMQLLSVQLTGWPKLVYKQNAIDPNKITNVPGEMIEDRLPGGQGDGVKYLAPPSMTNLTMGLVDAFMDHTKSLSSAQDASTGDVGNGQLNASAIMLLQKAAGVPIESIKKRFYRTMEDIGRIWEQFWKVKYNTTRKVIMKDDNGKPYSTEFNGSSYSDVDLNLKIDIGPSSSYSEELMMSSLDKLFDGQHISLEDYLEFAPKNVIPFKDRLLKKIEAAKQAQNAQIVQQMPPDMQAQYAQSPPEVQQQLVQQFMQMQQQPPQVDPQQQMAMHQEQQAQQQQHQIFMQDMNNQHDMKKHLIKTQADLQKTASKVPAGQR